jgi:large conductance mechanosensitive channel
MSEFISFIRRQGVIGLAIGFILGGAINGVVHSLVKDVIQPILSFVITADSISFLEYNGIFYGRFFIALLDFVILAAVVYFIFKKLALDKLDLPKEDKNKPAH